ncbi:MAG: prephenate dehydratase [Promethearchaeota archaeon]
MKDIEKIREEINQIDDKILDLIEKRILLAKEIGKIKNALKMEIFQPLREAEILDRLKRKSKCINDTQIDAIWKEIMGACKAFQELKNKVGFLGPKGTFSHQAALEFFPITNTEFFSFKTISEIFENIEKDVLNYGVVPIENSLHGTVRETLDLLIQKELLIYGEIELRIIQNLISLKEAKLSDIQTIYSHPQAFAQTNSWLKANFPKAQLINVNSTAEAVQKVKELNDCSNAAIGPQIASQLYKLKILASNIEDEPSNYTRFLIISKNESKIIGDKIKTSIVFVTKHVPGALFRVIKLFAETNINLLKIESRPRRKGKWEYIFLMDFEGSRENEKVKAVLNEMENNVIWSKILGTYPYK